MTYCVRIIAVTLEVETLTAANEPSNEPEAVTTANEEGQENEEDDNEKEAKNTEKKELQIQRDIAIAVQGVWTRVLLSEDVFTHVLALGKYELPPPAVVMDLLTQLARHLALDPILYSDQHNKPSWSIISHNILPELKTAIERHVISLTSGDQDVITASGNTNEAIKATCEENGLFDITTYSSLIPSAGVCALLGVLTSWLQKSLEAQERVVAYLKYGSDDNEQIVTE